MVIVAMKLKHVCFLEEKHMINLSSILKRKDVTLPAKVCTASTVVMYGCERWTIKMAEC